MIQNGCIENSVKSAVYILNLETNNLRLALPFGIGQLSTVGWKHEHVILLGHIFRGNTVGKSHFYLLNPETGEYDSIFLSYPPTPDN